jgi:ribosome-binding factor A
MAKRYLRPRDTSARHDAERGARLRGQRLEELFREELNSLLEIEINDPALEEVCITRAELSSDGSRARVWFALPLASSDVEPTTVREAFERAAGFLRSRLCEALPVKRVPELIFRHDPAPLASGGGEPTCREDE